MIIIREPTFSVAGKNRFKVQSPMIVNFHHPGSRTSLLEIAIPPGFCTDFASIPRFFRRLIPVNGRHRLPALVHDYLYLKRGMVAGRVLSRKQCDIIFRDAMKSMGVKLWRRELMYRAVRLFGGSFWNSDKN